MARLDQPVNKLQDAITHICSINRPKPRSGEADPPDASSARRAAARSAPQLRAADAFWLSTVRPGRRPHVTRLIAVWHAAALWFANGPQERKAINLAENPSCVLTTGRSDLAKGALDVVLEGRAEQVTDDAELEPVAVAFVVKYSAGPWDFAVCDGAFSDRNAGGRVLVFRVRPVRGLRFRKGDHCSQTTWRWTSSR